MAGLLVEFSEQAVQAELDRIAREHVQREEYEAAAAACERLAGEYPESKWLGNVLLLAASCYRELGRPEAETGTLQRFLDSCPDHPRAPTARQALEKLQARHGTPTLPPDLAATVAGLEGRIGAALEALEGLQQSRSRVEQLSATVDRLEKRFEGIDSIAASGLSSTGADGTEIKAIEVLEAVAEDLGAEAKAQRQSEESRLHKFDQRIAELRTHSGVIRSVRNVAVVSLFGSLLSLAVATGLFNEMRSRSAPSPMQPAGLMRAGTVRASARPSGPEDSVSRVTPASAASHGMAGKKSAAPVQAAAASGSSTRPFRMYTVQPGDTLWKICRNQTGGTGSLEKIAVMNGLREPYTLHPGRTLRLPR